MSVDLHETEEVLALADTLGVDDFSVVGRLHRMWSWIDKNTIDGEGIRISDRRIDKLVGLDGFAAALRHVGWLDGSDGEITIPKFDRWNGGTGKERARGRKRTAKHRGKGPDVTVRPLPENSTGQKKTKTKERGVAASGFDWSRAPAEMRTQAVRDAWGRWCAYRREAKLGHWKPVTLLANLRKFVEAGLGGDAWASCVDEAISNGWRGVFVPKGGGKQGARGDAGGEYEFDFDDKEKRA
jgi:hypothetical protein